MIVVSSLALTGCVKPVSSVLNETPDKSEAICSLSKPTFTEEELMNLSDRTFDEVEMFFRKLEGACNA